MRCVCVLFGLYIIQPVFAARSPNEKKKKEKKGKKTIFTQGSQLSAIVDVLYRMKKRRKGFSTGR